MIKQSSTPALLIILSLFIIMLIGGLYTKTIPYKGCTRTLIIELHTSRIISYEQAKNIWLSFNLDEDK